MIQTDHSVISTILDHRANYQKATKQFNTARKPDSVNRYIFT